jgi:hypothetical protein
MTITDLWFKEISVIGNNYYPPINPPIVILQQRTVFIIPYLISS